MKDIEWKSKWANWRAYTADGEIFEYENMPIIIDNRWNRNNGFHVCVGYVDSNDTDEWKSSLEQRVKSKDSYSIKWVNDWANWRAYDEDGDLYEYEREPGTYKSQWGSVIGGRYVSISNGGCDTRPDWKETLEQRVRSEEKPASTEWNGEGLPPVGVVCEYQDIVNSDWYEVEITYLSDWNICFKLLSGNDKDVELSKYTDYCPQFRPIKSKEEIDRDLIKDKLLKALSMVEFDSDNDLVDYLMSLKEIEIKNKGNNDG